MKKQILILMCLIFLSGFVIADGEELSYDPNTTMDIKLYCFDINESLCASGITCYLSAFYPNKSIYANNVTMSQTNTYRNYTLNRTTTRGVYNGMANCVGPGAGGYEPFFFYVGRPSTYVQENATNRGIFLLLGIAALLFFGFLFVKKDPFRWTFFLFSILFIIITINVASISLANEAGSANIRSIFDTLAGICYYIYWFIAGLFLFLWIFTTIASLADRERMKQAEAVGEPTDFT